MLCGRFRDLFRGSLVRIARSLEQIQTVLSLRGLESGAVRWGRLLACRLLEEARYLVPHLVP
jgi:hypothetical protein